MASRNFRLTARGAQPSFSCLVFPRFLTVAILLTALAGAKKLMANDYPYGAIPTARGITVPGLPAVYGLIRVDQFGYLPDEKKIAVLADPQIGYNVADRYTPGPELEVRRVADGKVVHRGAPALWNGGKTDPLAGDRGWWFDFSGVRETGEYYLYDAKNQVRSHVFRVAPDVFQGVLRAAVRVFYYQREAIEHRPPYAEEPWTDAAAFLADRATRALWAKDDPRTARDLSGGWMDAGDTNKYVTFLPDVIHSLLYAWRDNPAAFTDDFGIPESGNGRPDLLDEVKWELDWLLKMQDVDGGVFIKMGDVKYLSSHPPSTASATRYYGPKGSASAIAFAGVTAHAARVFGHFGPWKEFAEELARRSELAYAWYKTHPRTTDTDSGEIKSGLANKTLAEQDALEAAAAMHLFALTGRDEYHQAFKQNYHRFRQMADALWSPYEAGMGETLLDYTRLPAADPVVRSRILDRLSASLPQPLFSPPKQEDLYRASLPRTAFHWGSNTVRAGCGSIAMDAVNYGVAGERAEALRQRAADLLHSFHGVNPLGLVYLTNMQREGAEISVMHVYHNWFDKGTPFEANPPAGYVTGGPNATFSGKAKDGAVAWIAQQPPAKAYADFNDGWPLNSWELAEPAIYYQAAYIRLLASFARPTVVP